MTLLGDLLAQVMSKVPWVHAVAHGTGTMLEAAV
jgi:hypothetical protein